MNYKPLPIVSSFIAEFKNLPEDQRRTAIGEMAGFCIGYREGLELPEIVPVHFVEDSSFYDCDGEPQVQSEEGASALAATMTELDVKPHRGDEGGQAPAPKGWA